MISNFILHFSPFPNYQQTQQLNRELMLLNKSFLFMSCKAVFATLSNKSHIIHIGNVWLFNDDRANTEYIVHIQPLLQRLITPLLTYIQSHSQQPYRLSYTCVDDDSW